MTTHSWLLDMDGVLAREEHVILGADRFLARLRELDQPVGGPRGWLVARCDRPTPIGMTIGASLCLIAVGAILKWAVTAHVEGVNLQNMGVILMVVGGAGLALGLFLLTSARSRGMQPPPEI